MANEFVARKGLISSGSINVSGSVTASFFKGDGSQLINLPGGPTALSIDTYTFDGNGSTTNYILSQSYDINSLIVSVDGLTQTKNTDYNISASTVTFTDTPPSASNILVRALVNATQNMTGSFTGSFKGDGSGLTNIAANITIDTYTFQGNGSTVNYVLSQSYNVNSLVVSVEGLTLTNVVDYSLSGPTLTFVTTPPSQSNILVRALISVTQNATGSFSGSFLGTATSASYATNALFVLNPNFSGSFTGSFVGDGSALTFTTLNTSQSSDSQLLIGNKYNNYQYKQTTIFKNGDVIISGSTTITEDGVLVLKPRSTPSASVAGTIFYSSSGELYLGT